MLQIYSFCRMGDWLASNFSSHHNYNYNNFWGDFGLFYVTLQADS